MGNNSKCQTSESELTSVSKESNIAAVEKMAKWQARKAKNNTGNKEVVSHISAIIQSEIPLVI